MLHGCISTCILHVSWHFLNDTLSMNGGSPRMCFFESFFIPRFLERVSRSDAGKAWPTAVYICQAGVPWCSCYSKLLSFHDVKRFSGSYRMARINAAQASMYSGAPTTRIRLPRHPLKRWANHVFDLYSLVYAFSHPDSTDARLAREKQLVYLWRASRVLTAASYRAVEAYPAHN